MVWVKHDDNFSSNPKVFGLSDKAYRLHMCAIEYCARFLTDGIVTPDGMAQVASTARCREYPQRFIDELVANRLWIKRSSGWRVHDFLKYNRSKSQVEAHRKEEKERQARWRSGQPRHGVSHAVTDAVSTEKLGDGSLNTKSKECPHCGLTFKTAPGLREHMSDVHWDDRPLKAIDGGAA